MAQYQIRHKAFGIFQGSQKKNVGLYWYPSSGVPGKGIHAFGNEEDAQKFIDVHCRNRKWMLDRSYWVIEPFDVELDSDLRGVGVNVL